MRICARLTLPLLAAALLLPLPALKAQEIPPAPSENEVLAAEPEVAKPLPDITVLMYEVEAHQKASEAIQKDYLYRSVETQQEKDGSGNVKKSSTREYDVFWVGGVPVRRMIKKDGKELSPDEQKKQSERIDKEVEKAHEKKDKADANGKQTTPRGNDEITVSRFLELGSFTNARRVRLLGRDAIVIDFQGNPKAKTRNRGEDVVRDLVGTLWIDEQDRVIRQLQGHFLNAFHIGGGLLVNIRKDTSFGMEQRKINNEVWLPARIEAQGSARAMLLFNFNGSVLLQMSDYRKFKATSTILPVVGTVDESAAPIAPATSTEPSDNVQSPRSPHSGTMRQGVLGSSIRGEAERTLVSHPT